MSGSLPQQYIRILSRVHAVRASLISPLGLVIWGCYETREQVFQYWPARVDDRLRINYNGQLLQKVTISAVSLWLAPASPSLRSRFWRGVVTIQYKPHPQPLRQHCFSLNSFGTDIRFRSEPIQSDQAVRQSAQLAARWWLEPALSRFYWSWRFSQW